MSKISKTPAKGPDFFYHAAGVIKFDYKSAWYKELIEIAQDRAKRYPGFYHILVRFVSEHNLGIQFAYATYDINNDKLIKRLKDELHTQYGKGIYARDISSHGGKGKKDTLEKIKELQQDLVVCKTFPME